MTTTSGANYKYKYDDNGNRLLKNANGEKEIYLRDHTGKELTVYNLYTSRIKMANLYGNGLLGKANVMWDFVLTEVDPGNWEYVYSRTDERNYYIKDHLGNIRIVLDKNGEVVNAQDYYPFGEIIAARSLIGGGNVNDKYNPPRRTPKRNPPTLEINLIWTGATQKPTTIRRLSATGGVQGIMTANLADACPPLAGLQVDPLADKYPGWSPYNYTLNNPVRFIDENGDSVSIITSGPTTQNTPNAKHNSNSVGGHTAINIDGTVYSFEGDGKWHVISYSDYINNEKQVRTVIEQTIKIDQKKVEEFLENRKDGIYNVYTNSCVTNTMQALENGGIQFNVPDGAALPEQLSNALQENGYVSNAQKFSSLNQSSIMGSVLYKIIEIVAGERNNISGINVNTVPLISK